MRRIATTLGLVLIVPGLAGAGESGSPVEWTRRGNAALTAGRYDEALAAYRQADVSLPDSPRLKYNEGLVQYRLRDFAKARELFTEALSAHDLSLEAASYFNLGNCAYSQALEKLKSYDEAIELAQEAIRHYRSVLELAKNDADARANIETARLLIKDLQDKKKKEEEEKKKQQPQSQPSSQPQSQPSTQPKQQDQKDKQKQDQQKKDQAKQQQKKQQEQQKQQQQRQQEQQNKQQEAQGGQKQQRRQMSRDEAMRMLQAVRDKERNRMKERARGDAANRVLVDKDW